MQVRMDMIHNIATSIQSGMVKNNGIEKDNGID
jgi:hypothetical protein